jgi:hypothetical protein
MRLSIMALNIMAKHCYAECYLCWVSVMLSVTYAVCHLRWGSLMLSVTYAECHLCWVSLMLSVTYAECHLYWVSLTLCSLYADECRYAECHYAACHYAQCHGATCVKWLTVTNTLAYYGTEIFTGAISLCWWVPLCWMPLCCMPLCWVSWRHTRGVTDNNKHSSLLRYRNIYRRNKFCIACNSSARQKQHSCGMKRLFSIEKSFKKKKRLN